MALQGYECGTVCNGRFRLLREISDGGAAYVFLARDLETACTVALKVVKEANGPAADNLVREAEALRAVRHPNVVGFIQAGTLYDGRSFLAMRYARGHSLRTILQHGGAIAVSDALTLAGAVADRLAAIHAAGMIHRDLKPDNIVVPFRASAAQYSQAVLLDLGVFGRMGQCTRNGAAHTRWGRVSGTAQYMAPEQLAGRAQTTATDAYALGLLLHEVIYGTVPLADEDVRVWRDPATGAFLAFTGPLVRRRLVEHVALPAEPRIDPALHDLIRELLHPNPACRSACMADVARSLRNLHAHEQSR